MAYLDGLQSVESAMGELADARGPERIAVAQDIVSREVFPEAQRAAEDLKREVRSSFESRGLAAHVSRILDEPINQARFIALGAEPAELNARGAAFCREYNRLVGLAYPFDPRASDEPTLDQLAEAFKPQESLVWNLLSELDPYVELRGSRYRTRASASATINPDFLDFLGNARGFSEAVFSQETGAPEVRFRLRPDLDGSSPGVTSVTLDLNGRLETCLPTSCRTSDEFTWDGGAASQLGMSALIGGENVPIAGAFRGPWAVFRFFGGTTGWRGPEEDEHTVRWRVGPSQGEVAVTVVGRVSSAFNPAVMAGLRCIPTVVARR
jgi:type VI protein secretion system component VasK